MTRVCVCVCVCVGGGGGGGFMTRWLGNDCKHYDLSKMCRHKKDTQNTPENHRVQPLSVVSSCNNDNISRAWSHSMVSRTGKDGPHHRYYSYSPPEGNMVHIHSEPECLITVSDHVNSAFSNRYLAVAGGQVRLP